LLRSRVTFAGAGPEKTILKLEANPKTFQAVMMNQNYANPDSGEADHDITLQDFTIDVAASDQVLRETELTRDIPVAGEQEVILRSVEGVHIGSLLRMDTGPNEEIVPIIRASGVVTTLCCFTHTARGQTLPCWQTGSTVWRWWELTT
jgi:hypothetical protein